VLTGTARNHSHSHNHAEGVVMPSTTNSEKYDGFTNEERGAMKERARELESSTGRGAKMSASDRAIAERLHAVVKAAAPVLTPKLWYGMPAYARDGKVVCFFQSAAKFKTRYAILGFSDEANFDEGAMWPTYFALTELTSDTEERVGALVRQAVS
jgi:uncharacterized protein YdhG (YjbR/CyaY superfamily)